MKRKVLIGRLRPVLARTATDMYRLGALLGRQLRAGDVVGLIGPLGAGKTTFVQGMARGLDVAPHRHVASPTFALVNEHPGRVLFVHADLYRIKEAGELVELGLADLYDKAAVAIEWLDRFPQVAPEDHLEIVIEPAGGANKPRRVTVRATGPRAKETAGAFEAAAE